MSIMNAWYTPRAQTGAAIVLSRASRLETYNIGGTVSPITRAQEGDWAVHEMERLHVDVSVVCPAGISIEHGLTQATPAAAAVSRIRSKQSKIWRSPSRCFLVISQLFVPELRGSPV